MLLQDLVSAEEVNRTLDRELQQVQRRIAAASRAPEILRTLSEAPASSLSFGSPESKNVIVMIQDINCGMCAKAIRDYGAQFLELARDQVARFEIRDMSLVGSKKEELFAAQVRCAHPFGKYFELLEMVQRNRGKETAEQLVQFASELGIPREEFRACLTSQRYLKDVEADVRLAAMLKVDGTPTFYVNGEEVLGSLAQSKKFQAMRK